jgi:hypothetical protein
VVLREIGWCDMDWIHLAQDRYQWRGLVNTVMKFRVPYNAGKFLSSCTFGRFSRRTQLHEVKLYVRTFIFLPSWVLNYRYFPGLEGILTENKSLYFATVLSPTPASPDRSFSLVTAGWDLCKFLTSPTRTPCAASFHCPSFYLRDISCWAPTVMFLIT